MEQLGVGPQPCFPSFGDRRGHWLIAESSRFGDIKGAEDLEVSFILPAIRQFNVRRLNNLIRRSPAGQPVVTAGLQEIVDGPRALRSLFDTTEYNIASSQQLSGLHPALEPASRPPGPVDVPDAFFVDANLLTGGGPTQTLDWAFLRPDSSEACFVSSPLNTELSWNG